MRLQKILACPFSDLLRIRKLLWYLPSSVFGGCRACPSLAIALSHLAGTRGENRRVRGLPNPQPAYFIRHLLAQGQKAVAYHDFAHFSNWPAQFRSLNPTRNRVKSGYRSATRICFCTSAHQDNSHDHHCNSASLPDSSGQRYQNSKLNRVSNSWDHSSCYPKDKGDRRNSLARLHLHLHLRHPVCNKSPFPHSHQY
jgi:hypothetical protein